MDLIRAYPLIFLFTVLLPFFGGIVGAYMGWDALKGRARTERHQNFVESRLTDISAALPQLEEKAATIRMYQQVQDAAKSKDQYLVTVLAQYERMKNAAEVFEQISGRKKDSPELNGLAETILSEIRRVLPPIRVDSTLPNNPLIILIGENMYRVLFSVPMRVPPHLEFQNLPTGVAATITENSEFGFTVLFSPRSVSVEHFTFTADADF
jgi:hypothetical protein